MSSGYIQRVMTATREELEAPARVAVKEAIAEAFAAGHSVVGTDKDGNVAEIFPDGAAKSYSSEAKYNLGQAMTANRRPTPSHPCIGPIGPCV